MVLEWLCNAMETVGVIKSTDSENVALTADTDREMESCMCHNFLNHS